MRRGWRISGRGRRAGWGAGGGWAGGEAPLSLRISALCARSAPLLARLARFTPAGRPLAPSASRWNYYSESDKPAFIIGVTSTPPSVLFPAKPRMALPLPRGQGEGGRRRPGPVNRGGCGSRKERSPGGSRWGRPWPIKGRWAGIRERGSFFSPSPPALGIREGRLCRRRAGEETQPCSPALWCAEGSDVNRVRSLHELTERAFHFLSPAFRPGAFLCGSSGGAALCLTV